MLDSNLRLLCLVPLLFLATAARAQDDSAASGDAAATAPAAAQGPCSGPEHRQFNFWLGTWDVHNKAQPDRPPARNVITSEHDGCMVHEEYVAGRYNGSSINSYNKATKSWHQTWSDNQGTALFLKGGLDKKGRMVLSSDPKVNPIERITWTPLKNGDVRQHWQQSKDGGKTWTDAFDGIYKKASD